MFRKPNSVFLHAKSSHSGAFCYVTLIQFHEHIYPLYALLSFLCQRNLPADFHPVLLYSCHHAHVSQIQILHSDMEQNQVLLPQFIQNTWMYLNSLLTVTYSKNSIDNKPNKPAACHGRCGHLHALPVSTSITSWNDLFRSTFLTCA